MKNQNNLVKYALAKLTPLRLRQIKQPTNLAEARENLLKYYNCVDRTFRVYLSKIDLNGDIVDLAEGRRENGTWVSFSGSEVQTEPHPAVIFQHSIGDEYVAHIDIDQMVNLRDVYDITGTGFGSIKQDPSFCMNVWMTSYSAENRVSETLVQMAHAHQRIGYDYSSDWLRCEDLYKIFANDDPFFVNHASFTRHMNAIGLPVPMYQLNNLEMRYLHWLLLGPLAPYQFKPKRQLTAA
jgi:hypothetical protein